MSTETASIRDRLLMEILKLEGKLNALQRVCSYCFCASILVKANVFTLSTGGTSPREEKLRLTHHVSSLSTDVPDESSEGLETPSNEDDREDEHDSEDDSSSMSDE